MKSSESEIDVDHPNVEEYVAKSHLDGSLGPDKNILLDLIDISAALNEAASAIVDDSFTRCFKSNPPETWNWNLYLFLLWSLGVFVRYLILFPVRVVLLVAGWVIFLALYIPVHFILKSKDKIRQQIEATKFCRGNAKEIRREISSSIVSYILSNMETTFQVVILNGRGFFTA